MKNQELSQTISWQRPLSFIELYGNCRKKNQACRSSPSAKIKLFN